MKVLLDTSVIVDIDRKKKETIDIVKSLVEKNHEIMISMVTISEIFAGSYLRKDSKKALAEAKRILGQFLWIDFDAEIADKTAQYIAYLITEGKIIEYQDIVIAATFKVMKCDYLLTANKQHFENIADIKEKIVIPEELSELLTSDGQ
jgi:predicted nucleic acid-binding protein